MGATRTTSLVRAIGYGLALALLAVAGWGALDLWNHWQELAGLLPAAWDCSSASLDDPSGAFFDPCEMMLDARRRLTGVAYVYAGAAVVGGGLAGLLLYGQLGRGRVRSWAWLGAMLVCAASLGMMGRLTLEGHPAFVNGWGPEALRVLGREPTMLTAAAGMLVVAAFVLLAPVREAAPESAEPEESAEPGASR